MNAQHAPNVQHFLLVVALGWLAAAGSDGHAKPIALAAIADAVVLAIARR